MCIIAYSSYILYAIEAWGSGFKTDLDKLLILQKRALRLMTYNDVYPTVPGPLISSVPIFVKLGILITDIYKYQVSKFIFKCINKLAPLIFKTGLILITLDMVIVQVEHEYCRWQKSK